MSKIGAPPRGIRTFQASLSPIPTSHTFDKSTINTSAAVATTIATSERFTAVLELLCTDDAEGLVQMHDDKTLYESSSPLSCSWQLCALRKWTWC
jgi:hypothetical protein